MDIEEFKEKVSEIFQFLNEKIYISDHFYNKRVQGREQRENLEEDILDVLQRFVNRYKELLLKKKQEGGRIADAVIKSRRKHLTVVVYFKFKDDKHEKTSDGHERGIRFITANAIKDPLKFITKGGDRVITLERFQKQYAFVFENEKTPKQPKMKKIKKQIINKRKSFLEDLLSRIQHEE